MPKNKFGGKHKHLKKEQAVEKYHFLKPGSELMYAYVSKAYGNRMFDIVILESRKTIRIHAQYRKRKARISVGILIKVSCSDAFTSEYYAVEDICGENETREVQKSDEYQSNYRMITNEHDIVNDDSFVQFGYEEAKLSDEDNDDSEDNDQDNDDSEDNYNQYDSEELDLDDL